MYSLPRRRDRDRPLTAEEKIFAWKKDSEIKQREIKNQKNRKRGMSSGKEIILRSKKKLRRMKRMGQARKLADDQMAAAERRRKPRIMPR